MPDVAPTLAPASVGPTHEADAGATHPDAAAFFARAAQDLDLLHAALLRFRRERGGSPYRLTRLADAVEDAALHARQGLHEAHYAQDEARP